MTAPTLPDDVREKVRAVFQQADDRYGDGHRIGISWADAAIKAYHEGLSEAGFVVVPREPSEAMIRDGHAAAGVWRGSDDACWLSAEGAAAVYSAMIAPPTEKRDPHV